MVVRIKRNLFFKPRFCPDCGKTCLFCRHYLANRCEECHKKQQIRKKRRNERIKKKQAGSYKYGKAYQRRRKRTIKQHPYCALCGSVDDLTKHHVGGGQNT